MSSFDRAVKALNDVDEASDHLADNTAYVTALQAAGLLMPDVQVIRGLEELEALDADTVVISSENGEVYYVKNLTERHTKTFLYVPAVVIATGEQVLAAREALAHIPPKVVRTDSN